MSRSKYTACAQVSSAEDEYTSEEGPNVQASGLRPEASTIHLRLKNLISLGTSCVDI